MKHFVRGVATLALLAGCIGQAKASLVIPGQGPAPGSAPVGTPGADPPFDFSFSGGGVTAIGSLDATANGDGSYTAISGSVTVYGSPNLTSGTTLSLYLSPNGTSQATSPSGFFWYDNQLMPSLNPLITNNGLLFRDSGTNFEVNIFSNGPGPGTYQYYENTGFNTFGDFTLTAVPEPATFVMGGTALLAGLGYTLIRRRKVAIA
jgi:hypothetical protein